MLKLAHVQDCYNALLASGLAPRTVKQAHMVLHKALGDAVRLDLVTRNAAHGATLPRVVQREMATLTGEQVKLLHGETQGDRFHALWVLLSMEGLRIGEALGLRWSDVNLTDRVLHVRRALQRQQGNGLTFVEPKTERGKRSFQMTQATCAALREHKERQAFERKTAGEFWQHDDLVFCTAFGTPLDRGRIHLNFQSALRKAGLPRVRIHDLRHTAATLMREQGVDIEVVQRKLGHSSISVTVDVYGHVSDKRYRDAADRMDELLSGL
jgi:integrase